MSLLTVVRKAVHPIDVRLLLKKIWPIYETVRTAVVWPQQHRYYDPLRNKMIRGRRLLIVGSGPSARELSSIPDDVVILVCKGALRVFRDNGWNDRIGIYLSHRNAMERDPEAQRCLDRMHVEMLVLDDLRYGARWRASCRVLAPDDGKDNFYLKRLAGPRYRSILEEARREAAGKKTILHVSSGMRLLEYALYFGAQEIYLAGVDLSDEKYFWGGHKKQKHLAMDRAFMRFVRSRYSHVWALSAKSPLASFVPSRPLSALPEVSQTPA